MILTKVLIDTNICLDVVLQRKPFAAHTSEIIQRSEKGDFEGIIAAHSFDTIFYIIQNRAGKQKAYKAIDKLSITCDVALVDQRIIEKARKARWDDFEDAIQYYSASEYGCDAIITRNKKDFIESELPVSSPNEFLDQLKI